jgi:pimeloyl-ACP methyl ester carboxylesterase
MGRVPEVEVGNLAGRVPRIWFYARTRTTARLAGWIPAALLIIGLAGCSGSAETTGTADSASPDQSASATESSTASTPDAETTGMYDVGGHQLYMSCAGDGPTTVVLVHGWVNDVGFVPHVHATGVRDLLVDDYRVCLYDRRNVGSSETVDAVQTPADVVRDMHAVLKAGGERPPYILWAGSFGGLVASAYLQAHPGDVKGVVFVDAMFPDELGLDRYLPRQYTFKHFDREDRCCTLERISQFDLIRSLQPTIGREPDIPAIYLASQQEPRNENDYESPEYDARILDAQAAFVDRFSPGILRWVDAPHFMEPVVPDVIADAVREVDRLALAR